MRKYLTILLLSICSCKANVDIALKGYSYPESLSPIDSDNFIFPLRDSLSRKDSLEYTEFYRMAFTEFTEPNLSIRPQLKPVYRMLYTSNMDRSVVITMTENAIVVKEQTQGYGTPFIDKKKLSLTEEMHYELLFEYYPLQEVSNVRRKKYLDSLVALYPQILEVSYYKSLLNKAMTYGEVPFAYKTEVIPISKETYSQLATAIDSSDFWDVPYKYNCINTSPDGSDYLLEVNTPKRYKVVLTSFCSGYSRRFHKAWQKLSDYVKMSDRLNLEWPNY